MLYAIVISALKCILILYKHIYMLHLSNTSKHCHQWHLGPLDEMKESKLLFVIPTEKHLQLKNQDFMKINPTLVP